MVLLGYICTRLKSILFNVEFMSPSISHYLLRLYNLYIVCLKHKEIYIWLGEGGAVEHGYWIIQPTNAVYWFWFSSVHLFTFVSNIFYLYCFIGCVVIYCFSVWRLAIVSCGVGGICSLRLSRSAKTTVRSRTMFSSS